MDESLRHPCATHPDNAAQFVRGRHTLQGETSWRLLGLDRLVAYCPWCGANLAELHRLLAESKTRAEREAARSAVLLADDPELGIWRTFTIAPSALVNATVFTAARRCGVRLVTRSENRGLILQSIRIARTDGTTEEQLVNAGVPLELYFLDQPHIEHDCFPLGPGETLLVTIQNPSDRTMAAEVAAL